MEPFISSIASEIIVAIVFVILGSQWTRLTEWWQLRHFRKVFGTKVGHPNQASIVFSEIIVNRDETTASAFAKYNSRGEKVGHLRRPPSPIVHYWDLQTALLWSQFISRYTRKDIRLISDSQQVDYSCALIVFIGGPVSNIAFRSLLDKALSNNINSPLEIQHDPDNPANTHIINTNTGEKYYQEEKTHHAFILRFPNFLSAIPGGYIFACGGIDGYGTQAAGKFLENNWMSFLNYPDTFGLILEYPVDGAGLATIASCATVNPRGGAK
ncbi:MAG: hypothetical protein HY765_03740 [Rhodomicrobium sp.]|nr:hypothetical protein [Rhodomicrobium sp.]